MPAPYILRENNWKSVQSQPYDIAVLPWGATEAHNYHLPFGTDTIETEYIARMAACQGLGKRYPRGCSAGNPIWRKHGSTGYFHDNEHESFHTA